MPPLKEAHSPLREGSLNPPAMQVVLDFLCVKKEGHGATTI